MIFAFTRYIHPIRRHPGRKSRGPWRHPKNDKDGPRIFVRGDEKFVLGDEQKSKIRFRNPIRNDD